MATWIGKDKVGQFYINKEVVSALYLGVKNGAVRIWENISNCIAGGWWQHGHGWQYGIGWGQKENINNQSTNHGKET